MQFRLSTLFLLFVVLWSSLAAFGGGLGTFVFILLVSAAICIARRSLLLVVPVFLLLMALLPSVGSVHEAARRIWCSNQLKQIALALHNYRQANGCFPPACIADKNGKPMHSWRVLILPYMEEQALYKQYNFNEPWDGPSNKKLLASRPRGYSCPSDRDTYARRATSTSYVAVVGSDAAWPGDKPKSLTGDLSKTIMVVEVADANIQWSEPRDVSLDALLAGTPGCVTPSSKHADNDFFTYTTRAGGNVALADGNTEFVPAGLLDSDMLKVGGFRREYLEFNWANADRHIHWTNCAAFAVWVGSSGWLLVRAVRSRKKAGMPAGEKAKERNTIAGS